MATQTLRTAVVIDAKDRTRPGVRSARRGVESISRSLDTLQRRAIALDAALLGGLRTMEREALQVWREMRQ